MFILFSCLFAVDPLHAGFDVGVDVSVVYCVTMMYVVRLTVDVLVVDMNVQT